ncbi:hypothetical protein, partial [Gordonia aichiensis]
RFNAEQRRLATFAPATALGINMHLYWVGPITAYPCSRARTDSRAGATLAGAARATARDLIERTKGAYPRRRVGATLGS